MGYQPPFPISNYSVSLAKTGTLTPKTYVYQLENVQDIFNQVYPNWKQGNFTPSPGITMWLVTNEPDYNNYSPAQVAQLA